MYFYYGNGRTVDENTKETTKQNAKAAQKNSERISELENQLEYLTLVVESLWELTKEKNGLSDDALRVKIDAVVEAKKEAKKQKLVCDACGQKNSAIRDKCAYCGNTLKREFEDI